MGWRIGIDLGTNSLGWWVYEVVKEGEHWRVLRSVDGGVLIFPDGREPAKGGRVGDSNAVSRRISRGMRRNRDHGKNRLAALVNDLMEAGLLPADKTARDRLFQTPKKADGEPERFNPYRLRAEAMERTLNAEELGRALFHLGLRRGFKSNRREASEEDGGSLKKRIDDLRQRLGKRTLGQFLWDKYQNEREREQEGGQAGGIRFRGEEDFYPDRAMTEAEFDAIREKQEPEHGLGGADWDRLRDRVLFQHPLRDVERGACEFFIDQPRHFRDTPITHDFRIYQELNNLRLRDRDGRDTALDAEQRGRLFDLLMTRKSEVKFTAMRKEKRADKSPLFPRGSTFNLEGEKRKGLNPHKFAALANSEPLLKPLWQARDDDNRLFDDVIEFLHKADDHATALAGLCGDFNLDEGTAELLASLKLSPGTSSVSRKFMEQIVPILRDQGLIYNEAVAELTDDDGNKLHHSLRDDGRRWAELPYYGEVMPHQMLGADQNADPGTRPEKHFGRINNPTVHVALNQLRRLMNSLIERFGHGPAEVHLELVRDLKLSRQARDEKTKEQAKNQRENERIRKFCALQGYPDPSARDIRKVKLWEELDKNDLTRRCVYTGQNISAAQLFNGDVEIEHILPFSRTLDDSLSNMTLSMKRANRLKGNKTPHEAFGQDQHAGKDIRWSEILDRIETLHGNKKWRFTEQAMDRFDEKNSGFINRQLTDTAYMSRIAQRYLGALETVEQVVPNVGRLTGMVRGKWGLNGFLGDHNRKVRDDHRHHAVDAAAIGLVERSLLQGVSTQRGADDRVHIRLPEIDADLYDAIRARVPTIVVAHKPDHGLGGKMFKETAYGFIAPDRRDPDFPDHGLVARMALAALTPKQCATIRDRKLRARVAACLEGAKNAGVDHDKALAAFARDHGVKSARVLVKDQTVVAVPSAPYKGYAPESYAFCDIWRAPKGGPGKWAKDEYVWQGVFWPYAETIGGEVDKGRKKPHPAARYVTRLFKDDMVAYEDGGETRIMRVAGFSTTNNRIDLRPHNLTDSPQRYFGINVLGAKGLRRLHVTADGRILDHCRGRS